MNMKNLLLSTLALTAFLVGCSSDDNSNDIVTDNEIRLSAGVVDNVVTRAAAPVNGPINSTFTIDFPIGIYAYNSVLNWQAGASNSSTPNVPNIINNDHATVLGDAGHSIDFATGPYYYPSGGEVVNFKAYAPYGTESTAAGAGSAPEVTIALDGQQDVMYASGTGHKAGSTAAVHPILNFAHKLSQLQFTFKSGTGYPASGNSVVSLLVKSQPNSLVMNIGTGVVTTSGSANMQALSTASQTSGIAIVTGIGTNANSPIITAPASGSTAYTLDIVVKPAGGGANVTYEDVQVNISAVAGSSYMITLVFNATTITATAAVADWTQGIGVTTPVE